MQLFYAPFACSLASHIALLEAGLPVELVRVTLQTKKTEGGADYQSLNPKGQVPMLRLDDGATLTEGPAVLQYIADQRPDTGLAPPAGTLPRYEMQAWLNYISTEIHKQVFWAMFNPESPPEVKAFVRPYLDRKLAHVAAHLATRPYLVGDRFTVADAYLVWALNLCGFIGVNLADWPALAAWFETQKQRPAVATALAREGAAAAKG